MAHKIIKPDSKGQITLGRLVVREKWLLNNKLALKKTMQGIKDARVGRLSEKGSFLKFIDENDEE